MLPLVSVIVPVYNSEKYISQCLESILNQTYTYIEVIIINDGSFDKSEEEIKKFQSEDNRIIYLYQDNSGPSAARNNGLNVATGEFLVFIDSDDTIENNYIEILVNEIVALEADIVFCGYKDYSIYGTTHHTDFIFDHKVVHLSDVIELICQGTGGVLWSKIFRNKIISKYNLKMDSSIFMSEDLIFVLQYVINCKKFGAIKKFPYNYNRMNPGSISSNISLEYADNYIAVCKHLEVIFKTVQLDKWKKEQIINRRLIEFIISVIESECIHMERTGFQQAKQNISKILAIPYIKNHIRHFYCKTHINKPLLFFIRNNKIGLSIIYTHCINALKNVKKKLIL